MGATAWRAEAAAQLHDELAEVLRHDGVRLVAVDVTDDGALATFLTGDDPRLFGRVVPWDDPDEMTPSEWASDAWMHQMPWTTYGTRRVERSAYIEVTDDDLPVDHPFSTRSLGADRASFDVHPLAPATVMLMLAASAAIAAARTGHDRLVSATDAPALDALPKELLRSSGTWWERLTSRTRSIAR